MDDELIPRLPLFRIMFGNALLVSILYLGVGLGVEGLRRLYPAPWVRHATLVLDSLPANLLQLVGLMEPLSRLAEYGRLAEPRAQLLFGAALRLVYELTTVGFIFLLAVVVGGGMWLVRFMLYRRLADR